MNKVFRPIGEFNRIEDLTVTDDIDLNPRLQPVESTQPQRNEMYARAIDLRQVVFDGLRLNTGLQHQSWRAALASNMYGRYTTFISGATEFDKSVSLELTEKRGNDIRLQHEVISVPHGNNGSLLDYQLFRAELNLEELTSSALKLRFRTNGLSFHFAEQLPEEIHGPDDWICGLSSIAQDFRGQ